MFDKQTAYKSELIKHLYFNNTLSCSELSMLTKKSLPLTAKFLDKLLKEKCIEVIGFANSTGGRRAQTYSLKPDFGYMICVAMDQFITKIGILDMHNNIVGEVKKIDLPLKNNQHALVQLRNNILEQVNKSGIAREKMVGIGIGMPGFVDVKKGVNYMFLPSAGGSIVSYIKQEIDLPILIDNDSSLLGLAELRLGDARYYNNVMVINIGWGVGLGMILEGKLFRGHNGFAGEFSHIPVFKDNKKICSCGKTGCLETETSLLAIIGKAIDGIKSGRTSVINKLSIQHPEESWIAILNAASRGDTFAIELISEAGYNLGLGIAILITLLNPELIILTGLGAAAGKLWLAPIQQAINEHCIPKIAEDTQLKISTLGEKAALIGAAALVMENYERVLLTSSNIKIGKNIKKKIKVG